jgi:tRNA modification GTPase
MGRAKEVFHVKQTIFALASAQGRAGVAVVRLSGPQAFAAVRALCAVPKPRQASLRNLTFKDEWLDQALVLTFVAPHSFTGEDCAEFHLHGSPAILERFYAIMRELGLRLAEPGEFSRRAFENGKLDLTQAEAIADLVDAESEAQRQQALRQLGGELKAQYGDWRDRLTKILAHLEVLIDFPDEDIPASVADKVLGDIREVRGELQAALKDAQKGRQIREGFRIAIMGKPNAGKSSLFNALLQTDAAIVTSIAGTTRDVLESPIRIGDYQALLYDTAGLRETEDVVEREGIRRARARAGTSDLRLWVIDAGEGPDKAEHDFADGDFVVLNKRDTINDVRAVELNSALIGQGLSVFETDLTQERGVSELRQALQSVLQSALSMSEFPAATRERHFELLSGAEEALTEGLGIGFNGPELMAEDIRKAISRFDALFGKQDVERVLDHIFSSFCIGK